MADCARNRTMPLTPFQSEVLRLLAKNRSPKSYVAGGVSLNAQEATRFSSDVDVFHDVEEAVIAASEADVDLLIEHNYSVRQDIWAPTFRRAWITKGENGVKLEWCQDSAWRFFPIEPDDVLGWKLSRFDALTNKALAMGGRAETRDLIDLVTNASHYPLHSIIWSACAKDPGYTPLLLLNQMQRNSRVNPAEMEEMGLQIAPYELKTAWIEVADRAKSEIDRAASAGIEPGLAFLSKEGKVGWFDSPGYSAHRASLRGSLPRIPGAYYGI